MEVQAPQHIISKENRNDWLEVSKSNVRSVGETSSQQR